MKKQDLFEKVSIVKEETKNALQTMYDALNAGQQKKNSERRKSKSLV